MSRSVCLTMSTWNVCFCWYARLISESSMSMSKMRKSRRTVRGLARDLAGVVLKHFGQNDEQNPFDETALIDDMLQRKRLRFMHSGVGDRTAAFGYRTESKGTRTLISLLIPALEALSRGALLVIDELDTSLHPSLARAFVSLFTKEDSNRSWRPARLFHA